MINTRLLVLFDLDGTLVDPAGAITGGISEALRAAGLPVPSDDGLRAMVGPSLVQSLTRFGRVPENRLDEVIASYRAGYRERGMADSRHYPGVVDAIGELRRHGHLLAVATQKPEWLAEELLEVQGLSGLFDSIHGSPRDERVAAALDGKSTIIAAALAAHQGEYDAAIMVGDRSHDVHGAAANNLPCVAVTWGFGSVRELAEAGPAVVVDDAGAMLSFLLNYVTSQDSVPKVPGAVDGSL